MAVYAPSGGLPKRPTKNVNELMLVWRYFNQADYGSLEDILAFNDKHPKYMATIKNARPKIKWWFNKLVKDGTLFECDEDDIRWLDTYPTDFSKCDIDEVPPWDDCR